MEELKKQRDNARSQLEELQKKMGDHQPVVNLCPCSSRTTLSLSHIYIYIIFFYHYINLYLMPHNSFRDGIPLIHHKDPESALHIPEH
jgi:hypothetical protein